MFVLFPTQCSQGAILPRPLRQGRSLSGKAIFFLVRYKHQRPRLGFKDQETFSLPEPLELNFLQSNNEHTAGLKDFRLAVLDIRECREGAQASPRRTLKRPKV